MIDVQFGIAKWVFVGCIIFSFLLLGYEWYKARQVVLSRDISYAFTNVMANDYFSIKSYDNFCLFCRISSNRQRQDKVAFFVFFTFKSKLSNLVEANTSVEAHDPRRRTASVDQRHHLIHDRQGVRLFDR